MEKEDFEPTLFFNRSVVSEEAYNLMHGRDGSPSITGWRIKREYGTGR
jgi:hypothetical protein